jgi:CRP/FNR family cyclic AMP-dependent transcriptional regulator
MEDMTTISLQKSDRDVLEKADQIEKSLWANALSSKEIVALAGYMDAYEANLGTTILNEGGMDGCMLLVVSGRVEILKCGSGNAMKTVATIGPGQSFGEMTLIDGEPRSASALAATHVSLLLLSKENFTRLVDEEPKLGAAFLLKLAVSMSRRLRQTTETLVEL